MEPAAGPEDVEASVSLIWQTIDGLLDGTIAFLPRIAVGLVILAVFWFIGKAVRALMRRSLRNHPSNNLGVVAGRLAQLGIGLFGLLIAATIAFPSVKPVDMLGLLGVGSVAFGFAFKDVLQNFLAGILILLRQPFRIGDQIKFKDFEGTVEAIETRTTNIRTYDGRRVFVPNGEIFTSAVTVNTAYGFRRSEHDIGIGYGDDPREAARLIVETLRGIDGVRQDPPPEAIVMALDGSTVNIRARWWAESKQHDQMLVRSEVVAAIKDTLTRAGIDLPFPTQVVLFHDQTEETDGDRTRQREGWPAGKHPPKARTLPGTIARRMESGSRGEDAFGNSGPSRSEPGYAGTAE
ncbi:mechanosensitive ion channel family protein [Indioceanicola profundi]|uniref:mechanosensitive ion channel family protein n=1 Tax=Indioceanicola profundi TaxID=2220096 RepID=UPI001CEC90E2|nr:mechanosensitive ion channel family protein [Indioceanicola profundi]